MEFKRALYILFVKCGALCAATAPTAPPAIGQNGVVNAASQIPPTLAGGAIARGALFHVYGVRLGGPGHATAIVTQNQARIPAKVIGGGSQKIEVLMPASAPLGAAMLIVSVDGQAGKAFPIQIVASNPGIFSQNGEGWGPAKGSGAQPLRPGQRATLALTGLGNAKQIRITVGRRQAVALPSRRIVRPGEEEISFRIPEDAPSGCAVPVYLIAAAGRASNVVTMAIRSGTGACDPGPVPSLTSAERIGVVALSRTRMKARRKGAADEVVDDARISFKAESGPPALSPARLLPPMGTCTAYTSSFQSATVLSNSIGSLIGPEGRGLDAGAALILARGAASRTIGQNFRSVGNYRAHLGLAGYAQRRGTPPLFLEPGEYTLTGRGGRDVGAFRITIPAPAPFTWVDRDQTETIDRGRGVTVHWKDAPAQQPILVVARNVDQITTGIGMCVCVERGAAGRFTIPAELLANVPATRDIPGIPYDELVLAALPGGPLPVHAPGLQGGFVFNVYATGRIVTYR